MSNDGKCRGKEKTSGIWEIRKAGCSGKTISPVSAAKRASELAKASKAKTALRAFPKKLSPETGDIFWTNRTASSNSTNSTPNISGRPSKSRIGTIDAKTATQRNPIKMFAEVLRMTVAVSLGKKEELIRVDSKNYTTFFKTTRRFGKPLKSIGLQSSTIHPEIISSREWRKDH
jgi:hypothetical protein